MKSTIHHLFLVMGSILSMGVLAAVDPDVSALRERVEHAVLEWMESQGKSVTEAGDTLALRLDLPEQYVADVGIVFDGSWDADVDKEGLRIIALRPRGAAARMGLKEDDRIITANGVDLRHLGEAGDGRARAAAALAQLVAGHAPGQPLELGVVRDGQELRLSGLVDSRYLPPVHIALGQAAVAATGVADTAASHGCGEISSFAAPPRARDLFPVMIVGIDDTEWYAGNRTLWRVPAGTYQVRMVELISDTRLRVPAGQRGYSKVIEITVEANHTYEFAARFVQSSRYSGVRGDYWEPVVWRSEPKVCKRVDFKPRPGSRE